RAERRSRLAKGHRRRRREAVWTAASTARRLIRSGLPPRHYPFRDVLVAETLAFENLVSHPAKDLTAGRKSNAKQTSSKWLSPIGSDASCPPSMSRTVRRPTW